MNQDAFIMYFGYSCITLAFIAVLAFILWDAYDDRVKAAKDAFDLEAFGDYAKDIGEANKHK